MGKPLLIVLAIIMAVVGLVWIFQGLNLIKGSFMTGQIFWTIIGIIVLALGGGIFWFATRKTVK